VKQSRKEVQIDTTQPLGKSGPTLISAIDDFSRHGFADCYFGNRSCQAAEFLRRVVWSAPFPITAVRTDSGSEFKKDFIKACEELDIKIIRNLSSTHFFEQIFSILPKFNRCSF